MRLITLILLFLYAFQLKAQLNPALESSARAQLEQRGISEVEMREKLRQKGVNLDQISPDQLPALQPLIEQSLKEIEAERALKSQKVSAEKKVSQNAQTIAIPTQEAVPNVNDEKEDVKQELKKVAAKSSVEVSERIKNGATVEEAVTETLQEESREEGNTQSKIYGQELFRNKSLDVYRTTKDARPPDSYILGVGDEVTVVIFGQSQGDFKYVLDDDGFIYPPGVGRIFLKGVSYGKARELVRARFSRAFLFREDQFSFILSTARIITVNIFGETANYGSFTVSAVNTAFNAIAAAGGPSNIGSIRNIKLTSNGKVKDLDVYAFMNNPALQYDFYLDNNDVIFVPVAEKIVQVIGAVNRPFSFELKSNETLADLINFAGGFTASAYRSRLQIRRNIADRVVVMDIDYLKDPHYILQNGDQVTVTAIPSEAQNTVTVIGEVDFPGNYALERNLDLAALVFKIQPKRTARKDLAFIVRKKVDGGTQMIQVNLDAVVQGKDQPIILEPLDQLMVFKQERYHDVASVYIKGAVREPLSKPYYTGLKLSEFILLSGGLRDDATDFGYILRTNPGDRSRYYLKINPQKAVSDPASSANISLLGLDEVKVLSKLEFRDSATIKVSGSVRNQVELPYGQAITLSDAIKLAGGLRLEAARGKIDLFSIELKEDMPTRTLAKTIEVQDQFGTVGQDILLQPFDEIIVRAVPDFSFMKKVLIQGAVKYPGEYAITVSDEKLSSIIQRAGGLSSDAFPAGGKLARRMDSTGIIVTRMDLAIKDPMGSFNIILKDGDVIDIPKSLDLVTIRTLNTNTEELYDQAYLKESDKISVAFHANKRGRWYINEYAGGAKKRSAFRSLKVQNPNGHMKKTRNFLLFCITPKVTKGSKILIPTVPAKQKTKSKEPRKPVDWDKVFMQTLSVATATATLIIALKR
jgi:protein involved in polysaccharide export with SLBB domain